MARKRRARDTELLSAVLGRNHSFAVPLGHAPSPIPDRVWELAVGSRIAKRTRPVRLERGVLLVLASTSAWANELSLLSDAIVGQLRKGGVAVGSLRFKVGELEAPAPPARRPAKLVPAPVDLSGPLVSSLSKVADDELRAALEKAARTALAYSESRARPRAVRGR